MIRIFLLLVVVLSVWGALRAQPQSPVAVLPAPSGAPPFVCTDVRTPEGINFVPRAVLYYGFMHMPRSQALTRAQTDRLIPLLREGLDLDVDQLRWCRLYVDGVVARLRPQQMQFMLASQEPPMSRVSDSVEDFLLRMLTARAGATAAPLPSTPRTVIEQLTAQELSIGLLRLEDNRSLRVTKQQARTMLPYARPYLERMRRWRDNTRNMVAALTAQQVDYINQVWRSDSTRCRYEAIGGDHYIHLSPPPRSVLSAYDILQSMGAVP